MEIKARASMMEIVMTVVMDTLLILAVAAKLIYEADILNIILLFFICSCLCTWYVIQQPTYVFSTEGLHIKEPFPLKSVCIPYSNIQSFRVDGNFQSIKAKAHNRLIITYLNAKKEKHCDLYCYPRDVYAFVEALKKSSENHSCFSKG